MRSPLMHFLETWGPALFRDDPTFWTGADWKLINII